MVLHIQVYDMLLYNILFQLKLYKSLKVLRFIVTQYHNLSIFFNNLILTKLNLA